MNMQRKHLTWNSIKLIFFFKYTVACASLLYTTGLSIQYWTDPVAWKTQGNATKIIKNRGFFSQLKGRGKALKQHWEPLQTSRKVTTGKYTEAAGSCTHIQYNQHFMLTTSHLLKNLCHEEAAVHFLFYHDLQKHVSVLTFTEVGPLIPGTGEESCKRQLKCFGDGLQFVIVQKKHHLVNNSRFVNFSKAT